MRLLSLVLLCSSFMAGAAFAVGKLESYNVDPSQVSVSGISSGGAMAMQYHFAHSSEIMGVGIFAGLPYMCASLGLAAATACMNFPSTINVNTLISQASVNDYNGQIDSTSNIRGDKVYIYQGQADTTVYPPAGPKIQKMYAHYGTNIKTEFTIAGAHGQPTDNYGQVCSHSSADYNYINNCNYKGAFEMLNHLYDGQLKRPESGAVPAGDLCAFDQSEYFYISEPASSSMANAGYVYIPSGCKDRSTACRLHIVYHGCHQNSGSVGDVFVKRTGYLEAAELNNIIVLFPQAMAIPLNPNACWDWWGYLNIYFPTKMGNQILATKRMVDRIVSNSTRQFPQELSHI